MIPHKFSSYARHGLAALFLGWSLLAAACPARAVILYGTGDPNANTTAPTDPALANSGWQYEGQFNNFLGTPIAPDYFITAAHLGGAALVGTPLVYQGMMYTTTAAYVDPHSDLCIYKIDTTTNGPFTIYAPLYTSQGSEVNQQLIVFGRGAARGAPVLVGGDSHPGGWYWGTSQYYQRYGLNTVTDIYHDPNLGPFVHATFDQNAGPNEAILTEGDSGGGLFIRDTDGTWKLAGVNYGADGKYARTADGANNFNAGLYDSSGLYEYDGTKFVSPADNPGGLYSTEIAGDLGFIYGVVPEPSSGVLAGWGAVIFAVGWMLRTRWRAAER